MSERHWFITARRWILWSFLTALAAGVCGFIWFVATIPKMLRDLYGQWATAEVIIQYHQAHGYWPADWKSLEPVDGNGEGLHSAGMTFADLRAQMTVDFDRLTELESLASSASEAPKLPEIIYPKSGRQAHWSGAEPNRLIYQYLRERPQEQRETKSPPPPSEKL